MLARLLPHICILSDLGVRLSFHAKIFSCSYGGSQVRDLRQYRGFVAIPKTQRRERRTLRFRRAKEVMQGRFICGLCGLGAMLSISRLRKMFHAKSATIAKGFFFQKNNARKVLVTYLRSFRSWRGVIFFTLKIFSCSNGQSPVRRPAPVETLIKKLCDASGLGGFVAINHTHRHLLPLFYYRQENELKRSVPCRRHCEEGKYFVILRVLVASWLYQKLNADKEER